MSYPNAVGYPQYSGTFVPEIWSGKINYKFYDAAVVNQIANTDWEGEIKDYGDKVKIRQVPSITIKNYVKGQTLDYETPTSTNVELLIDKGKWWGVNMDDVDAAQSDIQWLNKFSDDASNQLKIAVDTDVLGSIYADIASTNKGATAGAKSAAFNIGTTGSAIALTKTNILDYITYVGAVLDEANVPETDRWGVLSPLFIQMIKASDLKDASLTGDGTSVLRNGRVGMIDRFTIYSSNLLTGVSDGGNTCYHLMFGHKSGLTFASQITKTEKLRAERTFGEILRGLQVYGYKVNLSTALADLYARKG